MAHSRSAVGGSGLETLNNRQSPIVVDWVWIRSSLEDGDEDGVERALKSNTSDSTGR